MRRTLVLAAVLFLLPALTAAQDLRPGLDLPSKIYLGAAAADWTTTGALFAGTPYAYEGNPMYGWVMDKDRIAAGQRAHGGQVAAVLVMSAAFDVATVWAVNRWVAPEHPKLAKALMLVGVGVRSGQAVTNLRRLQHASAFPR